MSQKEPFEILDFTPAVTLIANTGDRGWSLIPKVIYTGIREPRTAGARARSIAAMPAANMASVPCARALNCEPGCISDRDAPAGRRAAPLSRPSLP